MFRRQLLDGTVVEREVLVIGFAGPPQTVIPVVCVRLDYKLKIVQPVVH